MEHEATYNSDRTDQRRSPKIAAQVQEADLRAAYALLRLVLGVNILMHGATRLLHMHSFVEHIASGFDGTFIPTGLARASAWAIPIVEVILGGLLVPGLLTRLALIAGFVLMAVLTFGITVQQKWGVAGTQLIYCLIYFVLLAARRFNAWSLDGLVRRPRHTPRKGKTPHP